MRFPNVNSCDVTYHFGGRPFLMQVNIQHKPLYDAPMKMNSSALSMLSILIIIIIIIITK